MAVDPIAEARTMIQSALNDLEAEARRLERALASLGGGRRSSAASPAKRKRRSRRRAKPGQRRDQLLAAVKEQPGITVAQAAKKLGVKPPNALMRWPNGSSKRATSRKLELGTGWPRNRATCRRGRGQLTPARARHDAKRQ